MRRILPAAFFVALAAAAQQQDPGSLWDPTDSLYGETRAALTGAVEKAMRTAGQKVLLVMERPQGNETPEAFEDRTVAAWPDRTILFVSRHDYRVALRPSAAAQPLVSDAAARGFEERIKRRIYDPTFDRSIVAVLGDLGETLAGRPPEPWIWWRHPLDVLGGGQDAEPAPLAAGLGVLVGVSFLVFLFLRYLWSDPKKTLAQVALEGAGMIIGGLVSGAAGGGGGGGGGGSSFSGGGGDSGGGGASGSW